MKKSIALSLSVLFTIGLLQAQPKYTYLKTKDQSQLVKTQNVLPTNNGYLLGYHKIALIGGGKFRVAMFDKKLNFVDNLVIPKKVNKKRINPHGISKMGSNYVLFYSYVDNKKLNLVYDRIEPGGGYLAEDPTAVSSVPVKRKRRDYFELDFQTNTEQDKHMVFYKHKNIKVIVYYVRIRDMKTGMVAYDNSMNVIADLKNFNLKAAKSSEGVSGKYGLYSWEVAADNEVFFIGEKTYEGKEAKKRKGKAFSKDRNTTKASELAIFAYYDGKVQLASNLPVDVDVRSVKLVPSKDEMYAIGTYKSRNTKVTDEGPEGIFKIAISFDKENGEILDSDPVYFPYSSEFCANHSPQSSSGVFKNSKKNKAKEANKPPANTTTVEGSDNPVGGNLTSGLLTDVFMLEDGSIAAVIEKQWVIVTTTRSSDGTSRTTYTYVYDNLGVIRMNDNNEADFASIKKHGEISTLQWKQGFQAIPLENELVLVYQGKYATVDLESMEVEEKEIREWNAGNTVQQTVKVGNEVFIMVGRDQG